MKEAHSTVIKDPKLTRRVAVGYEIWPICRTYDTGYNRMVILVSSKEIQQFGRGKSIGTGCMGALLRISTTSNSSITSK